ncbi:hypothetical protein [Candidatus Poriferisocius sp.]|uniref:hypothetical protein n=1 Tax=Candidatus Poriferisocius sp. TaxID=3101276 RepID=UPI003B0118AD
MSSTDRAEPAREALDRVLDAVLYAPVGLLLSVDAPPSELASRGRRHVEAARLLGRMALGHSSAQPASSDDSADPKPG